MTNPDFTVTFSIRKQAKAQTDAWRRPRKDFREVDGKNGEHLWRRYVNKLDEGQLNEARKAVVAAASSLVSGTVPFIDGVRELVALRFDVSDLDHDPDFMVFVAIASESDHVPPSKLRSQCVPAWIEKCDRDARSLEAHYRPHIAVACARLLERYSWRFEVQLTATTSHRLFASSDES